MSFQEKFIQTFSNYNDGEMLKINAADWQNAKITCAEIDKIRQFPQARAIQISELHQDTFDYFLTHYAQQFEMIFFTHCPRVEDWSRLAELENLVFMHWFWNQKITKFWDMQNNHALQALLISDFTQLHSLAGLERANHLKGLYIGNAVWNKSIIHHWQYLYDLPIEYLSFDGKDMGNDLTFLSHLPNLKVFDFAPNQFTTEQIAWICANFPHLQGHSLHALSEYDISNPSKWIKVHGKRKPSFDKDGNEAKIAKYQAKFDELVKKFKGMPYENVK